MPKDKKSMMSEKQIRMFMALFEKEWRDENLSEEQQNKAFERYNLLQQVLGEENNQVTDAVRVASEYQNNEYLRKFLADIEKVEKK